MKNIIVPTLAITLGTFAAVGAINAQEVAANPAHPHENKGARMFEAADTNKDGVLTKAEMMTASQARAERMFDKMDLNKDGQVTRAEAETARKEMRAKFKERFEQMKKAQ